MVWRLWVLMLGYKGLSLSWAVSHLKMFDSLFVKCDSVKQGENICFSYFRNGWFKSERNTGAFPLSSLAKELWIAKHVQRTKSETVPSIDRVAYTIKIAKIGLKTVHLPSNWLFNGDFSHCSSNPLWFYLYIDRQSCPCNWRSLQMPDSLLFVQKLEASVDVGSLLTWKNGNVIDTLE